MITMTDLFCGAGGSSTGAVQVPGLQVRLAANHWAIAVETHNTNHPGTDHDCADLSQVEPRRYPTTDLLWASPECTNHSQARGRRSADRQPDLFDQTLPSDTAARSRATMWDVIRFAEHHQYAAIIVENVIEARDWCLWPAWTLGLRNLGYEYEVVYLNSMHARAGGDPAPQSRDRLYVVAWRAGNHSPDLDRWTRPMVPCPACGQTGRAIRAWKNPTRRHGRYRAQYVWRCPTPRCHAEVRPPVLPAAVAIDWTMPGQRIGDRPRPLAPATMARIRAGLTRYATTPQVVPVGGTWNDTSAPVTVPFRTRTTRETDALVIPLRNNNTAKPAALAPLDTIAANGLHHALLDPAPAVEDCELRMLTPTEIATGMAFPSGYRILGTQKEQVCQAGNAVTPPAARDLVSAVAETLTRSAVY
jgi:DNA (cytosine-5)-methyltransferase 1